MREWVLRYDARPWTTNAERQLHHMARARRVKEWREAFYWLAKQAKIPCLEAMMVVATPYLKGRAQDVSACHPAVKAAIDGVVDAGVLPDDDPRYLKLLGFKAPVMGRKDGLELLIIEVAETPGGLSSEGQSVEPSALV